MREKRALLNGKPFTTSVCYNVFCSRSFDPFNSIFKPGFISATRIEFLRVTTYLRATIELSCGVVDFSIFYKTSLNQYA